MPSRDMGGTRGSGAGANGYGNYGRGGAKPSSKPNRSMSAKAVVKREAQDPWGSPKTPAGRQQIAQARREQKAANNKKPTAAQKDANTTWANRYTGLARAHRIKQLKVGPRSVKQTTAASKSNPASTRKVVPKGYALYFAPGSRKG